jgi:hypothetical protein
MGGLGACGLLPMLFQHVVTHLLHLMHLSGSSFMAKENCVCVEGKGGWCAEAGVKANDGLCVCGGWMGLFAAHSTLDTRCHASAALLFAL